MGGVPLGRRSPHGGRGDGSGRRTSLRVDGEPWAHPGQGIPRAASHDRERARWVAMTAAGTVRWAATHGVVRATVRRQARQGHLDAMILADESLQGDPTRLPAAVRERPFARGGFALLTVHHDICTEVLRSGAFGVSGRAGTLPAPMRTVLRMTGPPPAPGPVDRPSMLAVDPPDHTRYRRLVSRAFSAQAVESLRGRTAEIADELLAGMAADTGPIDLIDRYAGVLPVTVICEVLGVPVGMRRQFLAWGAGAASSLEMGLDRAAYLRAEADLASLNAWMVAHLRRLRRDPGQDMLSRLVTASDEQGTLSEQELTSTALLVLAAGFETTVNLIGNAVALLLAHPEQRELLATEPTRWPGAVEEVLRYDSPVQRTSRRAVRDTVVGGVPVPRGSLVVALLAAANRDPSVFEDPDTFDVGRAHVREHLAFSGGIHFCLGAALARMEGEVALHALFERFPGLSSAGTPRRRRTRVLWGFDVLPVRW